MHIHTHPVPENAQGLSATTWTASKKCQNDCHTCSWGQLWKIPSSFHAATMSLCFSHTHAPLWLLLCFSHTHAPLWLLLGSPGEREAEMPCSRCTLLYSVFSNAHSSTEYVMSPSKQQERNVLVSQSLQCCAVSPPPPSTCSLGKVARINIMCIKGAKNMSLGENSLIMWPKEVSSVPGPTFHQKGK